MKEPVLLTCSNPDCGNQWYAPDGASGPVCALCNATPESGAVSVVVHTCGTRSVLHRPHLGEYAVACAQCGFIYRLTDSLASAFGFCTDTSAVACSKCEHKE